MFENAVNDEDAGSEASDNPDKDHYDSILNELILNIEDPEFVHNDNEAVSTRLNKGWNLFMSRLYVKNLVDVILISLKADKDSTSDKWRRDLLHLLFLECDMKFSVEYTDGLWDRLGSEDQVEMLNHEKERPTLESEYNEFNCESIMGSTGLGWDKAGENKYFHGRNISKMAAARKQKVSTLSECEEAMILLNSFRPTIAHMRPFFY
jgi:hypothetical protein